MMSQVSGNPWPRLAAVLLSALGSESLFTVPRGRTGCFCGVSQNSGSSWGRSSSGQNRGRAGRAPRVRLPGTAQATGRFPAVGGPGVRVPRLQPPRRSAGWACAVPARSLGRSAGRGGRVVAALREKPGSHHSPRRAWVGPAYSGPGLGLTSGFQSWWLLLMTRSGSRGQRATETPSPWG